MRITTKEGTFKDLADYIARSKEAAEKAELDALALYIALATFEPADSTIH